MKSLVTDITNDHLCFIPVFTNEEFVNKRWLKNKPANKACLAFWALPTNPDSCVQHQWRFKTRIMEMIPTTGTKYHL